MGQTAAYARVAGLFSLILKGTRSSVNAMGHLANKQLMARHSEAVFHSSVARLVG